MPRDNLFFRATACAVPGGRCPDSPFVDCTFVGQGGGGGGIVIIEAGTYQRMPETCDTPAPCQWPPLSKEETCPPLRFFHQIAHKLLFFLSPRKLHPVFHLKGGICVKKKDAQFPRVST